MYVITSVSEVATRGWKARWLFLYG